MGDFRRNVDIQSLPNEIALGISNHHFVDRHTDRSQEMKQLKERFSAKRRRYAGVIVDLSFDYFLIKHWARFSDQAFMDFTNDCYSGLEQCLEYMPERMQRVVTMMRRHQWLESYQTLDGLAHAIDQVSKRIRFDNEMSGGIEEVKQHYQIFDESFLTLFPKLHDLVESEAIEQSG